MKKLNLLILFLIPLIVSAQECKDETICLNSQIQDRIVFSDGKICSDCICNIDFMDTEGETILQDTMSYKTNKSDNNIGFYYYTIEYPQFKPDNEYTAYYICSNDIYSGSACIDFTVKDCTESSLSTTGGIFDWIFDFHFPEIQLLKDLFTFFEYDNPEDQTGLFGRFLGVIFYMLEIFGGVIPFINFIINQGLGILLSMILDPKGFFVNDLIPFILNFIWGIFLLNSLFLIVFEIGMIILTVINSKKEPITIFKTYVDYHVRFVVYIFNVTKNIIELGMTILDTIISIISLVVSSIIGIISAIFSLVPL